jgi:hypothetical protein
MAVLMFGAGALPPPNFFGLIATVNNCCQWSQLTMNSLKKSATLVKVVNIVDCAHAVAYK